MHRQRSDAEQRLQRTAANLRTRQAGPGQDHALAAYGSFQGQAGVYQLGATLGFGSLKTGITKPRRPGL